MEWVYSDGGRSRYFKAKQAGDCVTRAICNATGKDYKEVYDAINALSKHERKGSRKRRISNARNGVYKQTERKYLESIGWRFIHTMSIGSGCRVHLDPDELPGGALIVQVSRHLTCVVDGILYDTYDCTRDGNRCVYGYYVPETPAAKAEARRAKDHGTKHTEK